MHSVTYGAAHCPACGWLGHHIVRRWDHDRPAVVECRGCGERWEWPTIEAFAAMRAERNRERCRARRAAMAGLGER